MICILEYKASQDKNIVNSDVNFKNLYLGGVTKGAFDRSC